MGKKAVMRGSNQSQPPSISKTSKNHDDKHMITNKPLINSTLIKVLRPKVYITHSSSFKTLVQHLTGNGCSSSPSSSVAPPQPADQNIRPELAASQLTHHRHRHQTAGGTGSRISSGMMSGDISLLPADHRIPVDVADLSDVDSWLLEIDDRFPCRATQTRDFDFDFDFDFHFDFDFDFSGLL